MYTFCFNWINYFKTRGKEEQNIFSFVATSRIFGIFIYLIQWVFILTLNTN